MIIYFIHATCFDYITNFYEPIKTIDSLKHYTLIFPHEKSQHGIKSKDIIQQADLVIAEVSYPSIGVGIELAWADLFNSKIITLSQINKTVSSSLQFINTSHYQYIDTNDLKTKVEALAHTFMLLRARL